MMMILGGPDFCVQLPNDLSCQIGASVAMGDGCVPIFVTGTGIWKSKKNTEREMFLEHPPS